MIEVSNMPVNITREQQQQRLERNLKIASAIIGGLGLAVLVATLNTVGLGVLLLGIGAITVVTFPEETQEWVKWVEKNPFIIGAAALGATFNLPAAILFAALAYCTKLYFNKGISALHQVKEDAQEKMGPFLSILSWVTNKIANSLAVNQEEEPEEFFEIENIEEPEVQFFEFPEQNIEPFTPLRIATATATNSSITTAITDEDLAELKRLGHITFG